MTIAAAVSNRINHTAERQPIVPADIEAIDRDPCWHCGIRRDLGCRHHPLPITEADIPY